MKGNQAFVCISFCLHWHVVPDVILSPIFSVCLVLLHWVYLLYFVNNTLLSSITICAHHYGSNIITSRKGNYFCCAWLACLLALVHALYICFHHLLYFAVFCVLPTTGGGSAVCTDFKEWNNSEIGETVGNYFIGERDHSKAFLFHLCLHNVFLYRNRFDFTCFYYHYILYI